MIIQLESLQARRKIMSKGKSLPPSTIYPNRKLYSKRSPLELKGQYRMKSVMTKVTQDGWKLEQKWGGFTVEGNADQRYMPLDFLPNVATINGMRLDVEELLIPRSEVNSHQ
jgi:hypothetical protein